MAQTRRSDYVRVMFSQRHRVLVYAVAVLAGVWALVAVGYVVADHLKVTADKVRAYVESVDLSKLSAADRARALQKLEDELNALSLEERQHLRMNHLLDRWFQQMTEAEKEAFVESTMPTGIKQMLDAFDQMPPDKRQRTVNNAIKQLREDRARRALSRANRHQRAAHQPRTRPKSATPA